jgi:hypothetical protein
MFNSSKAPTPLSGQRLSANGAHEKGLEQQRRANGVVEGPGSHDNVDPALA